MGTSYTDMRDGLVGDLGVKAPVRLATTAAITLSGLQTIDGVALASGDRVLVKNQSNAIDNGIWVASVGAWSRAKDFDGAYDVMTGTRVYVWAGASQAGEYRVSGGNGSLIVGTDEIDFAVATTGSGTMFFDSRADAILAAIPPSINAVQTAGYGSAGDGGAALHKRAASAPSHGGYFQSSDGAYWVICETEINVSMFGALASNSSAVNTIAYQAAIDYMPSYGGRIYVPAGNIYCNNAGLTNASNKPISWEGPGRTNGGGLKDVMPGVWSASYVAVPNAKDYLLISHNNPANNDPAMWKFRRNASYTGGTGLTSFVEIETIFAAGAGDTVQRRSEWALTVINRNSSSYLDIVAITGQARREVTSGGGAAWSGHFNTLDNDQSGGSANGVFGIEVNICGSGHDSTKNRRILYAVGHNYPQSYTTAGQDVIGYGVEVVAATADINTGIAIASGPGLVTNGLVMTQSGTIGIDLGGATFSSSIAMAIAAGHKIDFSGSAGKRIGYNASSGYMEFSDGGSLISDISMSTGAYRIAGTKVIGPRDTGWTAMTGTANKNTAYDTSTVTLAQLAGRVMSLQAALTTHGLIGA